MVILLGLVLILCAIPWYIHAMDVQERKRAAHCRDMEAMVLETWSVVCDFLEYGGAVAQAAEGKYRGTICVRCHPDGQGYHRFSVSMYDSGDLTQLEEAALNAYGLKGFAEKYGFYYDGERDSIVYLTSCCVSVSLEEKLALEERLMEKLRKHPLAQIKSGTTIATQGI